MNALGDPDVDQFDQLTMCAYCNVVIAYVYVDYSLRYVCKVTLLGMVQYTYDTS